MALKMFNDWTAVNHGDFIAGLISTMKMMDNTQPQVVDTIIAKPMNIGGMKGLGISVSKSLVNEDNIATIDVFTRNVTSNTSYGMFSVTLNWDASRCSVYQLVNGEFGTFGDDMVSVSTPGRLNVIGVKEDGKHYDEPQLLFSIKYVVNGVIDKDNPIDIKVMNTNNYYQDAEDILENYTALLQMREGVWGYITPIENVNGAIVSEKETEKNILESDGANSVASPSMIAMGSSCTPPGLTGLVPIWVNQNIADNFPFDRFVYELSIDNSDLAVRLTSIVGVNGWDLKGTMTSDGGTIEARIEGTRDGAVTGTHTVGYLEYIAEVDNYSKILSISNSRICNGEFEFNVISSNGSIYYNQGEETGGSSGGGGSGGGGSGGGSGGYNVTGQIWSGTSQTIWITLGNVSVPVQLKPGLNDINVYLPYIFPEDTSDPDQGQLIIESEDYIWIPAGFRITRVPPENELPLMHIINYIDRIKSNEVFEMNLYHIEPPVDLDEIIDTFYQTDVFDMSTREVNRRFDLDDNAIDKTTQTDVFDMVTKKVTHRFELDCLIDELTAEDLLELYYYIEPGDRFIDGIDTYKTVDLTDMVMKKIGSKHIEGIVDEVEISDLTDMILKKIGSKHLEGMTDEVEIADTELLEFAKYFDVTCSVSDESHGIVTGVGNYEGGQFITLRAVPSDGFVVDKWYVDGVEVSDKTFYRFMLTGDIEIQLKFVSE